MTEDFLPAGRPHHVAPTLETTRVVLVAKSDKGISGSEMGLSVTSMMTAKTLRAHGVDCRVWCLTNSEELKVKLKTEEWKSDRPITHVIINTPGFIGPLCYEQMAIAWPEIAFVMLNHTGLAYLSIDHDAWRNIRWLLDLQATFDNVFVAGNNPRFQKAIEAQFGRHVPHLPNLYDLSTFKPMKELATCFAPLKIGSFAEGRPWKNQLVAAQAALEIARRVGANGLELYVNADRWVQTNGLSETRRQLLEDLPGVKLVSVPWQPWHTFMRTLETMHLLLYPSFDESFGMVPADGIAAGVPSVTTGALEWTPRYWQSLEPFDPGSIASVGLSLLRAPLTAVQSGRRALTEYVLRGVEFWLQFLTGGARWRLENTRLPQLSAASTSPSGISEMTNALLTQAGGGER